jgi:hypothetical protein
LSSRNCCASDDGFESATYPTDEEINEAAQEAAQEADSLVALLGVVPSQLHRLQGVPAVVLPGFSSLLTGMAEEDPEDDDISVDSDNSFCESRDLQKLIDQEEGIQISKTRAQDEQMMNLTCAALAITADEMMNVYAFPFGNFHCAHLINLIDKACHKWVTNTSTNWSLKNLSSYKTGLRHFRR